MEKHRRQGSAGGAIFEEVGQARLAEMAVTFLQLDMDTAVEERYATACLGSAPSDDLPGREQKRAVHYFDRWRVKGYGDGTSSRVIRYLAAI